MPELHRDPSAEDLRFARKPLDQLDPKRVAAYKARYRAIEQVFDVQIKETFQKTRTARDRHSTSASRALESEKDRKLEQLREEFVGMLDPTMFEAAKKAWNEFKASSPYKGLNAARELQSYGTTAATLAGGGVALGLQVGATGLLLTNPFTAGLALLNELDKWVGRAIGWVQMAKKQWDADCSRISSRVAAKLAEARGDCKLQSARAGAPTSTLTRQRLEKLLYKKILEVREETIKYKIRECEVTAEAQRLLEQKKGVEAQVHALEKELGGYERSAANLPPTAAVLIGGQKVAVKAQIAKMRARVDALTKECLKLSQKIADLLNEVVDNCSRLVNKAQVDVEKLLAEVVASFQHTEAVGKFTGAHTNGAWLASLRKTLT